MVVKVLHAIYKGLTRLLASLTLSPLLRDMISSFALKKNRLLLKFPVANSLRSLLALSLLLASIYTENNQNAHPLALEGNISLTVI